MSYKVKPLRTEEDYKEALEMLYEVYNAPEGSKEYDLAEALEIFIEKYENDNYEIEAPDPIEAIKYLIDEGEVNQKQLSSVLGDKSKVSLVLNKKRALSLNMIRNLNKVLKLPLELLIKEYDLAR